jgi:hypothetical protein
MVDVFEYLIADAVGVVERPADNGFASLDYSHPFFLPRSRRAGAARKRDESPGKTEGGSRSARQKEAPDASGAIEAGTVYAAFFLLLFFFGVDDAAATGFGLLTTSRLIRTNPCLPHRGSGF